MRHGMITVLMLFGLACFAAPADAAELRNWTAANGGFAVDAELIGVKPGDIVRLKTKDGREIEVPLAQLSAADRQYVKASQAPAGAVSPRLTKARRTADRCRLPDEALVVYQLLHDDPQATPAEKAEAAARIAELKELVAKKMVRLNKQWVSADEAAVVRKKADELMRGGLELMKLDNEEGFRKKFAEAAALEPEDIRADFLAAVIYTATREGEKALPMFQKCLIRDPENIAVLNNLALLSVAKGDWNAVVTHWRRALELQPDARVIHNLGRFLEQATIVNVNVPKAARDALALPYVELIASGKFKATEPEVGWLFLLIEESALDIDFRDDDEKPRNVKPAATEDGPVVGGGTGFVVQSGYVLTNAHVAQDGATFEIQLPDGKLLKATRIAADEKVDLALLQCEELTAPPLALLPETVSRGTDVMLLGYPEMTTLGASLKATRGSISAVPDADVNDRYLYDAVTNAGNSGGPVCDSRGNVIAVHYLGINTASRYGGGIPSPKALAFVQASLPDFKPLAPQATTRDWPQVDELVAPSTVLIWVRKKNAKAASDSIGSDLVELPICLFCSGSGTFRCIAPGCKGGIVARNGVASSCRSCQGTGTVRCQTCGGLGIDLQLASVQKLLADAGAAKGTTPAPQPAAPKPGAPKPAVPVKKPATTVTTVQPGQEAIGFDWRVKPEQKTRLHELELREIVAGLKSPTPATNVKAAKILFDSAVNPAYQLQIATLLEQHLAKDEWIKQAVCIRALEVWGRRESLPPIINTMTHKSWIVRSAAMYAVARSGDADGATALIQRLRRPEVVGLPDHDPSRERRVIAQAIIAFGPKAKADVEKLRTVNDPDLQVCVDQILAAFGP